MNDAVELAQRRLDLLQASPTMNIGDRKIALAVAVAHRPARKKELLVSACVLIEADLGARYAATHQTSSNSAPTEHEIRYLAPA